MNPLFTKREINGTLVLLFLIFIVFAFNNLYPYFIDSEDVDYSEYIAEIDKFYETLERQDSTIINSGNYWSSLYENIELFYFDPNTITENQCLQLGLKTNQIKTLMNFRNKGGQFYKPEDFAKIYGISAEQYQYLEPFIKIKKSENSQYNNNYAHTEITLFPFNPNFVSESELEKLGFSNRQITTLLNYRNSGGKFSKKDDLKKVYGIDSDFYSQLEPYIELPVTEEVIENAVILYEINTASEADLMKINGIGAVLASRIVKYRELLGGYIRKEQLKEVYGLQEETYNKINSYIELDISKIKKIDINFAEKYELAKHPYISDEAAQAIINYRSNKGMFRKIEQLLTENILNEVDFNKIKPYLKIL